jgi:hypothetical protein
MYTTSEEEMLVVAISKSTFLLNRLKWGFGMIVGGTPERGGKKLTWEKPRIYVLTVASDFSADVFSGDKESVERMIDCHHEEILGAIRDAQVQA